MQHIKIEIQKARVAEWVRMCNPGGQIEEIMRGEMQRIRRAFQNLKVYKGIGDPFTNNIEIDQTDGKNTIVNDLAF